MPKELYTSDFRGMKLNVEIKGINETIKRLKAFGSEAEKLVDIETYDSANAIALNAKRLAPVDTGKLRQGIYVAKPIGAKDKIVYSVVSNAIYSAYMEFGAGRLTSVPPELKELAIQFKGKGIREVNLQPQPFMYPSLIAERPKYLKKLKNVLKNLSK